MAGYSIMIVCIIIGEMGELCASIKGCKLFKKGGYLRDGSNILDWSVVLLWFFQIILWFVYCADLSTAQNFVLDPSTETEPIILETELV